MASSFSLRWLSLVAVIWLQSINGTNTNFPAYSSELKQILSLSQLQLNNLAFASDAGKLFGWFSGIAACYLPLWLVLLIGSILGLIGYGLQYLFVTHQISSPSYWHIFSLSVLAGNSICWINTVCYIVVVRNFPLQLQVVAGLTTSYIGLSAMIYAALVDSLMKRIFLNSFDSANYLLLNATLPLAISIITAPLLGPFDSAGGNKTKGLLLGSGLLVISIITVSTGLYGVISSLQARKLSPLKHVIIIGLCLALPLVVPLAECLRGLLMGKCAIKADQAIRPVCDSNQRTINSSGTTISDPVVDHEDVENRTYDEDVENRTAKLDHHHVVDHEDVENRTAKLDHHHHQVPVTVMEDVGVKLMLKRLNFWLYFLVYFLGATVGLVFLNNLGQIAESRGVMSKLSSLVTLSSTFGFFGRLVPCLLYYICSRQRHLVPGPAFMVGTMVPLSGAFFLLLNGTNMALCISTALVGVCTGAVTTICVSVTAQLFGAKNFGINHNVVVANIPIGSFVFGDLAALLYRRGSADNDDGYFEGRCFGLRCYRDTFIIWGTLCSLATLLALILHFRTRKFYWQVLSV